MDIYVYYCSGHQHFSMHTIIKKKKIGEMGRPCFHGAPESGVTTQKAATADRVMVANHLEKYRLTIDMWIVCYIEIDLYERIVIIFV